MWAYCRPTLKRPAVSFFLASARMHSPGAKRSFVMFFRTLILGCSLIALLASPAAAQYFSCSVVPAVPLGVPIAPIMSSIAGPNYVSSVPPLRDLARQVTDQPAPQYDSCVSHRTQNQHWAHHRRPDSAASMTATPGPQLTNEQFAASKFQGARLLWQNGNSQAARRWLEVVVRDYGDTPIADRARVALARL